MREWERTERGSLPSYTEALIILWQVRMVKIEKGKDSPGYQTKLPLTHLNFKVKSTVNVKVKVLEV